jgi:phosphonate transport system substrate-binding protein
MRFDLEAKPRDWSKSCGACSAATNKRLSLWLVVFVVVGHLTVGQAGGADPGSADRSGVSSFRLGTTPGTFGNPNINDTKAAITVWAQNIFSQDARTPNPDIVTVFEKTDELLTAYERRQVDGITLATDEFPKVKSRPDAVFLTYKNKSVALQYVVLVHRGSGIEDVRQLKGRKVVLHSSPSMNLATPWMDTLLASRAMGLSKHVFGSTTRIDAASRAILQVFFRQADACVVALDMFKTACELNPQVEKDLKPLAVSPDLIPTFFCFHPDYNLKDRSAVESAITDLHKSPAGQQVLTVFQSEKLVKMPVSILEDTLTLLAEYERIKRGEAIGIKPPQISQTSMQGKN